MLTLLLLLGTVAAGAGMYTLFQGNDKEKPAPGQASGGPAAGGYNRGQEIKPAIDAKVGEKAGGEEARIPEVEKPDKKADEGIPSLKKKQTKPKLTYSADEIITNNSRYSFHRRPLLNAEALVEKENYNGALEILNRTNARIDDEEINQKLNRNIEDLKNYLESGGEEEEYSPDDTYGKSEIPIRDLVHAIKDISEAIAGSLAKSFQVPFIPQGQGPVVQIPPEKLEEWGLDNKNLDKLVSPVVFQIIQQIPEMGKPQRKGESAIPGEETEEELFELPEDTFFSDEWEKFKDLPLKDRRGDEDRRKNLNRRGGDDRKKDRRDGDDRRKEDLFKEREDYLNRKAEEKKQADEAEKNKREKELEKEEFREKFEELAREPSLLDKLSDLLPPSLPGISKQEIPKLELPDPTDVQLALPELYPQPDAGRPEIKLEEREAKYPEAEKISPIGLPEPVDLEKKIEAEPVSREEEFREEKPEEITEEKTREPEEAAKAEEAPEIKPLGQPPPEEAEAPEIEVVDGDFESLEEPEVPETETEPEKVIHGILELKPPEEDDAPFLTLTYDFSKIPDSFRLSKNYSIMEYGYYKYKPMLMKAQEFARRKMLKNALNYYRVIKSQNIPPELKKMINRNIQDITEFLEKYLMAKGG